MKRRVRILAVDNNHDVFHALQAIGRTMNWDVSAAGDGLTAVERLQSLRPDLVVVSFSLPKRDDLKIVQVMRTVDKQVPILVLTDDGRQEIADKFLNAGANDFANKPIKAPDLIARIKVHLQLRRRQDAAGDSPAGRGINAGTLQLVRDYCRGANAFFYSEDVAENVGLAYKTALRYLQYLASHRELRAVSDYGKVGRPRKKYRYVSGEKADEGGTGEAAAAVGGQAAHDVPAGPGTVIRTCLPSRIGPFNPIETTDYFGGHVLSNVHAGLLTIDEGGHLAPGVAKSWHLAADNTWVFNLRKGAKFHNGREITAEDVKYSLERMLHPDNDSPHAWCLQHVEGGREFANGAAGEVSGIKVLDRYRVSIRLASPHSGFLANIGQYYCGIVAREEVERGRMVGCGPYTLSVRGDRCVLESFPHYFNGEPYIKRIDVRLTNDNIVADFLAKKYDFIFVDTKEVADKVKTAPDVIWDTVSIMGIYYAGFNLRANSVYVRNKEVRQAMNYAINKRRIIDDLLGGLGVEAKGPFPPNLLEDKTLAGYPYNPRLAKELLAGRIPAGSDRLKILVREGAAATAFNKVTDYIVADLAAAGIGCELVTAAPGRYYEGIADCDLFVNRWFADTADPVSFLKPVVGQGMPTNRSGYANASVDAHLDLDSGMLSPAKRLGIYKEMQRTIVADAPWIFLYHPTMGVAYQHNLSGLRLNPMGLFRYENITVDGEY